MCPTTPGEILSIHGADPRLRIARVSFGGEIKEVQLAYTPNVSIGDYVLAQFGFAIGVIDEREAKRFFAHLNERNELEEDEVEEEH